MPVIRVIGAELAERLLGWASWAELVREALCAASCAGDVAAPRVIARKLGSEGLVGAMPAVLSAGNWLGAKVVTVFPGNAGRDLPVHRGIVVLCEGVSGAPVAIVDGTVVTRMRTAALSAVASGCLARRDARRVAIIGCGEQGRAHVEALHGVCGFRSFRLWNRDPRRAEALARDLEARLEIECVPERDIRCAIADVDVICTVTSSALPILPDADIAAGVHVNAIGASTPDHAELSDLTIKRARIVVDDRAVVLRLAGDLILEFEPVGTRSPQALIELGAVLRRAADYTWNPGSISVFRSVGLGLLDVAAARALYERALAGGEGEDITL